MRFEELVEAHEEYMETSGNDYKFELFRSSDIWDFQNLDDYHVEEHILKFLNLWGIYRVPYKIAPLLTKALEKIQEDIIYFKEKKLWVDLTLDKDQQENILRIFVEIGSINKMAGVGIAKMLHMFCPDFFIMWDNAIAENYGCSINAQGYMNFLRYTQELIEEYDLHGKYVQSGFKECSLLKLIDEYNMMRRRTRS